MLVRLQFGVFLKETSMNWLSQIFGFLQSFQCWITIAPWESALRIRFGKNPKLLRVGINFRLPFFDRIFVQTNRLQSVYATGLIASTKDNKTLSIAMTILYTIDDIKKLYLSVNSPEYILHALVEGVIVQIITTSNSSELYPLLLQQKMLDTVKSTDWGLGNIEVLITSFAYVKTYRLLQNEYRTNSIGDLNSQMSK